MSNSSSNELFANVLKGKEPAAAVAPATPAPVVAVEAPVAPEPEAPAAPSEIEMLKNRARLMGLTFSNNIGVDALKAKIAAKLAGEAEVAETQEEPSVQNVPVEPVKAAEPVKVKSLRQTLYEENMRLIRVRITNLDPKKKNLPGEIFCVANEVLGAVKKFVPYGEQTDNGYHIPYWIYKQLQKRKFLNIKVRKDNRGREHVESGWAREFSLEVLEPLDAAGLARLAAHQAAAQGQD